MKAYLFPGQSSQFIGMGKDLYRAHNQVKKLFEKANTMLDIDLREYMFEGPDALLNQTTIAQPAIFLCSIAAITVAENFKPAAVAGHSLGEISALVANQMLTFEDGLRLIISRSRAMQKACTYQPGSMVAILGLPNHTVEEICAQFEKHEVTPANYNCPGQIVISGCPTILPEITKKCMAAGARKAIPLKVEGAFHSKLMEPAKQDFEKAIAQVQFKPGICPIYQNTTARAETDISVIKEQLVRQLTSPIYWEQTISNMIEDGITQFVNSGPGVVMQKLASKINPHIGISNII